MWARRGARVLRCMLPKAFSAEWAAAQSAQQPMQQMQTFAPLQTARAYTAGFWDVPQAARQELYIELHTIRNMLPNRNSFTPHFTPHGVMLMPNSSSSSLQSALVPAQQAVDDEDAAEQELEGPEVWADSVRRKRKLKMKKHKMKKRSKKLRHQQ